jgi:predicted alpha/beta-fold hydrolase
MTQTSKARIQVKFNPSVLVLFVMLSTTLKSNANHFSLTTSSQQQKIIQAFSTLHNKNIISNKSDIRISRISRVSQRIKVTTPAQSNPTFALFATTRVKLSPLKRRLLTQHFSTSTESTTVATFASHSALNQDAVTVKHIEFTANTQSSTTYPPVIFLHGLLGNKRNFATIGRSLSLQLQKSRRIFGIDLRNHGKFKVE